MEFNEMKFLWENQSQILDFKRHTLSDVKSLALKKQTKIFHVSEVVGLVFAYLLAGMLVYHFIELDHWFLRVCGVFLLAYLLIMPIYTLSVIRKLRQPDLINSNYKEIIDHFCFAQRRLKIAENISFVASPFLFIASGFIIAKLFLNIDVFDLKLNFQNLFFLVLTFTGAIILNMWAFRKRKDRLTTITQTLEE